MVGGRGGRNRLRTYRCAASLAKTQGERCPAPVTMVADRLEDHVDRMLRDAWAGDFGALVVGEPGDPEAARAAEVALEEAEVELRLFAGDVNARRLLGDAWSEALQARAKAVEDAKAAYRTTSAAAASEERLVSGFQRLEELTKEGWGQLLWDVVARVEVDRGRGPVEGRVRVIPHERSGVELPCHGTTRARSRARKRRL